MELQDDQITEMIIKASFNISNTLGAGFLEKVYENALTIELKAMGLKVYQQHEISVYYKNHLVGSYISDILVENRILVELKAVTKLNNLHIAQCIN